MATQDRKQELDIATVKKVASPSTAITHTNGNSYHVDVVPTNGKEVTLSVPETYTNNNVLLKIEPRKEKEIPQEKFRSFQLITLCSDEIQIKGKNLKLIHLYNVLQKRGLSATLPSRLNTSTMAFANFDWNPFCYSGPKVWYFTWNNTQCSITGTGQILWVRVHDLTPGLGESIVKEILEEVLSHWVDPVPEASLTLYTANLTMNGYVWQTHSTRKHRSLETIYLPNEVKQKLVNQLKKFYQSSDLYDRYGVTWKRVHLFHGPPGTGKTSSILALASLFKKNIAKLIVTPNLNGSHLEKLFQTLPADTFFVLEDVDSLFVERTAQTSVDFSSILNCMDGITTKRGLVLFMTTNHLEKLDQAFVRPGRVDCSLEFKPPTRAEFMSALKVLAPTFEHEHVEYLDKHKPNDIATLQKHLFDCIMEEKTTIL